MATSGRFSQLLGETWASDVARLRASQVVAESWIQRAPPTELWASQTLAELWVAVTTPFIVSQAVAEVWQTESPLLPPWRRYRLSAQAV